jgi:hypothetical protein
MWATLVSSFGNVLRSAGMALVKSLSGIGIPQRPNPQ